MKTIKLLTIGNSFSGNALTYLERIGAGGDVQFVIGEASLGGCSLEKHANLAEYTDRVAAFKTYKLRADESGTVQEANLQDALSAEKWDVITLQQVSHKSWRRETFEPWLGDLIDRINKLAPQAEVMLHQTWAYRIDSPFFPQNAITQEIMHTRIRENYLHFSSEYRCGILPSGEAVALARKVPDRAYHWPDTEFDYQNAMAPELPPQEHSLAAGWGWLIERTENGIPQLVLDAIHLNARGCYLIGAVWYEILTGNSILDNNFAPVEIPQEDLKFLRETAHECVKAYNR